MYFSHTTKNKKIIFLAILSLLLVIGIGFFMLKNRTPLSDDLLSERCNQENAPYVNSSLPVSERVDDLMEKNSIRNLSEITKYNLGALLSGGGAGPKVETPLAWLGMVNDFQAAAQNTCLKIPLLYGIDAIH